MPVEVIWTPQAEEDLFAIYAWIGLHNQAVAERWFNRIRDRADQLRLQPRLGPRRRDIAPTFRMLTIAPYLILYEHDPDSDDEPVEVVRIVRILNGRRNLQELF